MDRSCSSLGGQRQPLFLVLYFTWRKRQMGLNKRGHYYMPFSVLIFQMLWTERKQIIRYDSGFVYSLLSRPDLDICKCIKIFPSSFRFSYPAKGHCVGTETFTGGIHVLFLLSVMSCIGDIPRAYVEMRTFAKRISFLGKRYIFLRMLIGLLIFQLLFLST